MADVFAADFSEIPFALANNSEPRDTMLRLIDTEPIPGKVTEGGTRIIAFREVLRRFAAGKIDLNAAILETETALTPRTSPHAGNNKVFPSGWAERQIRTQISRFYNQAVLAVLQARGATTVYVPRSSAEDAGSPCSRMLAGKEHPLSLLQQRLVDAYSNGNWSSDVKIPNHPHCTHVIAPVE